MATMNGGRSAEAHTSASDRERRLPVSFRWRRLVILLTRARRPRTQAVRERAPCPVMGHTAVCGRDARAPRRASHPHEATQGTMPAHPGGVTLLSAGETPALPGGARTHTTSSASGTSRNDCAAPRQECILLIKIWYQAVYASEYD